MITFSCDEACCVTSRYKYWLWRICAQKNDMPNELMALIFFLQQFSGTLTYYQDLLEMAQLQKEFHFLVKLLPMYTELTSTSSTAIQEMPLSADIRDLSTVRVFCDKQGLKKEQILVNDIIERRQATISVCKQNIAQEFIASHFMAFDIILSDVEELKSLSDFSLDCLYRIHDTKMRHIHQHINGLPHELRKRADQLNYFDVLIQGPRSFNQLRTTLSNRGATTRHCFTSEKILQWALLIDECDAVFTDHGDWSGARVIPEEQEWIPAPEVKEQERCVIN